MFKFGGIWLLFFVFIIFMFLVSFFSFFFFLESLNLGEFGCWAKLLKFASQVKPKESRCGSPLHSKCAISAILTDRTGSRKEGIS